LNRVLLGKVLGGNAERALNESHLAHNVGLCQPADLTLANNVHCFISGNRVHCAIDGAEPLAGGDSFLQESVGGRKYEAIELGEKEAFAELAARINASKVGDNLRAAITNVSSEDCRDCYIFTLAGELPDVRDMALRKRVGGRTSWETGVVLFVDNLANSWKGIFLSWVLLSLGTPFWYDILKDLLRLRPMMASRRNRNAHGGRWAIRGSAFGTGDAGQGDGPDAAQPVAGC